MTRRFTLIAILAGWAAALTALAFPPVATAHEVPNEVTVLSYIKPEGQTLTLLLRVPMKSLRDVDIPSDEEGYLDLARIDTPLAHAAQLWIRDFIEIRENGEALPRPSLVEARVSLPSDDSFDEGYDAALSHVRGELPADTRIRWEEGLLDIAYDYPIASENSRFSITPALTRLGVQVNVGVRFVAPDGEEWPYDVHAGVGRIDLDPSGFQAARLFGELGFQGVMGARDYLLLLIVFAVPFAGGSALAVLAASFFAGQSIGLIASAQGIAPNTLWFPYLVQTLVPVSVLYLALEGILGSTLDRRWRFGIFFGMLCGFGLSQPLRESMQFAGSHSAISILAFDVGSTFAATIVLGLTMAVLGLALRQFANARLATIVLCAFVAHSAWHTAVERAALLAEFPWPSLGNLVASDSLTWLAAIVTLAAVLWLSSAMRPGRPGSTETTPPARS
jgi:hypothetical protein